MKCPVCNRDNVEQNSSGNPKYYEYICETCGTFVYPKTHIFDSDYPDRKDKLASYLFYSSCKNNGEKYKFNFIGSQEEYKKQFADNISGIVVSKQIVDNWYPKTLNEKVNLFLQMLESRSRYLGDVVLLNDEEINSATFCVKIKSTKDSSYVDFKKQYQTFLEYLLEEKYIDGTLERIQLQAKGWNRVVKLLFCHRNAFSG